MVTWLILIVWVALVANLFPTGSACINGLTLPEHQRTAIFSGNSKAGSRIRTSVFAVIAALPLIFLFAVRKDVGTDYPAYVEMFEKFRAGASQSWIEPLYGILNQAMAPFGASGVVAVFGVSAALAALSLFFRVLRSSPIPWLGMLILFGLGLPFAMTNTIRSLVAVGIVMLVLPAIGSRQLVIWSLGILLASGFHFTALLIWPLYWVLHLAWPRIFILVGLAVALVVSTARELAVSFLESAPAIMPAKYAHYPKVVLERLGPYNFGFGYLIYFTLICVVIVVWKQTQDRGAKVLVFRNAAMLGLLIALGLYQFWAVNRLALFFTPALAVFLPWVVMNCAESRERVLWAAGLAALFGLMFLRGWWGGAHDATPYQWIF